jgi:hypothetical protein
MCRHYAEKKKEKKVKSAEKQLSTSGDWDAPSSTKTNWFTSINNLCQHQNDGDISDGCEFKSASLEDGDAPSPSDEKKK